MTKLSLTLLFITGLCCSCQAPGDSVAADIKGLATSGSSADSLYNLISGNPAQYETVIAAAGTANFSNLYRQYGKSTGDDAVTIGGYSFVHLRRKLEGVKDQLARLDAQYPTASALWKANGLKTSAPPSAAEIQKFIATCAAATRTTAPSLALDTPEQRHCNNSGGVAFGGLGSMLVGAAASALGAPEFGAPMMAAGAITFLGGSVAVVGTCPDFRDDEPDVAIVATN